MDTKSATHTNINWENIDITESDIDLISNLLLEKETPMAPLEIAEAIVDRRIKDQKKKLEKSKPANISVYRPKMDYQENDQIVFPHLGNIEGKVIKKRDGRNPDVTDFFVITVAFADGTTKDFACNLPDHKLNDIDFQSDEDKQNLNPSYIMKKYGKLIAKKISTVLREDPELISIAGFWFPQALLMDVNPGFLNLAEAVMEMEEGAPVETQKILDMIEYPMDSNQKLTEFSFNYALQQDDRFDEVGPTGKVLWTLRLLEPEDVRKRPLTLLHYPVETPDYPREDFPLTHLNIQDELDEEIITDNYTNIESVDVCVSYPHWKAGTLPLLNELHGIFPTALETDNVIFWFVDGVKGTRFPGWVIISEQYICGLKAWYRENGVVPGSIIRLSLMESNDEVKVSLIPPRSSKDWIRTVSFDANGRIKFEIRQQNIVTLFDERQCIYVENSPQLDTLWEQYNIERNNLKKICDFVFQSLTKDNPQGFVHFLEIFAAANMMRRCTPQEVLGCLLNNPGLTLLDNYMFKAKDDEENKENE